MRLSRQSLDPQWGEGQGGGGEAPAGGASSFMSLNPPWLVHRRPGSTHPTDTNEARRILRGGNLRDEILGQRRAKTSLSPLGERSARPILNAACAQGRGAINRARP